MSGLLKRNHKCNLKKVLIDPLPGKEVMRGQRSKKAIRYFQQKGVLS